MDVIFCRNVLIYFTPEAAALVVRNLTRCLVEGGLLVLGPNEHHLAALPELYPVSRDGVIFYRKDSHAPHRQSTTVCFPCRETDACPVPFFKSPPGWVPASEEFPFGGVGAPAPESPASPTVPEAHPASAYAIALVRYAEGRYAEVAELLAEVCPPKPPGRMRCPSSPAPSRTWAGWTTRSRVATGWSRPTN